jgi:small subunit ribosomal protein S2
MGKKKSEMETEKVMEKILDSEAIGGEETKEASKELAKEAGSEQVQASHLLAQMAEKESLSSDIEEKKRKLLERAKKLVETEIKSEELKEKVKGEKRTDMLVPLEEYINSGIYIGTKVITPDMRQFVYRRRADGLAIFNTDLIDEKIKEGIKFLNEFKPSDVILVCKRQAGWKVAEKFGELTGIRTFTEKYPAGILTNSILAEFFENELTIISDSWVDKNALKDTEIVNKKVLMICDTNNFSTGADKIIIGNNKSSKSLGIIYYLLARAYCEKHNPDMISKIPEIEWWIGEHGNAEEEARKKARTGARFGV